MNNKPKGKKRYFASVWQNKSKAGNTYLSVSVDNQSPDDKYHCGTLIWFDKETGKYYRVKSMNVYEPVHGPPNLMNKLVIDIEDDYHVEPMDN